MKSWRDRLSGSAVAEVEELTQTSAQLASSELELRGGFVPFAIAVSVAGAREVMVADSNGRDAIPRLVYTLQSLRHGLSACAIVADVNVPELNKDAIRVTLEHREGVAIFCLFAYSLGNRANSLAVEQPIAGEADRFIWG